MSSLQTQAIDGQPNVIVIAYDTSLARLVVQHLVDNHLNVIPISPESSSDDFLNVVNSCSDGIYKFIWIHGFGEDGPTHAHSLIENLEDQNASIVFISRATTNFATKDRIYKHFNDQINSENHVIDQVFNNLPQAQVFIGFDVVAEEDTLLYPVKFLLLGVKDNRFLDPQVDLYLQTDDEFFNAIKLQILKPHKNEKYQVFGKKKLSSNVLKQLQSWHRQYFNKKLEILPVVSSMSGDILTNNFGIKVFSQDINIEKVLDSIVRRLSELEDEINKDYIHDSVVKSHSLSPPSSFSSLPHPKKQSFKKTTHKEEKFEYSSLSSDSKQAQTEQIRGLRGQASVDEKQAESSTSYPSPQVLKEDHKEDKLDKELKQIFGQNRGGYTKTRKKEKVKVTKKIVKKTKHKKVLFFGGIGIISIGVSIAFMYSYFQFTVGQVRQDVLATVSGEESSYKWTKSLDNQIEKYSEVLETEFFVDSSGVTDLYRSIQESDKQTKGIDSTIALLYSSILGVGGDTGSGQFDDLFSFVKIAYDNMSLLESKLENASYEIFNQEELGILDEYTTQIAQKRAGYSNYTNLQAFLPKFFGSEEKRTYAVLLQNDQELRATGGFIQAVGLLTFDQGMLINTQIYNIYDIDNKLLGEIRPPDEVKNILGEENWYLRDSNWDPDFPSTAKSVSWFINESLGVQVDGVVAINYSVIADILEATGPLDLPEYNEVLTDKNIYERLEFHSRDDLAQGEKNYTTLVFRSLLAKLKDIPADQALAVVKTLKTSLNNKQALISLIQKPEGAMVTNLGWDGGLVEPECPPQFSAVECFVDHVYQVESNVGLNKVNKYVKREIDHNIELLPGKVIHNRTISYKNTAKSENWPQGSYKAYMRLYVKEHANLENITINGQPAPQNKVTEYVDKNRQVFGILFDVGKGEEVVVNMTYSVPIAGETPLSYIFFNQRQPGLDTESLEVELEHPSTYKPKLIAPSAVVEGDVINFSENEDDINTENHFLMGVNFK